MPLSRLKLRPSYAYLQPPGSNTPEFPIRLPSDVRHGSGFYGTHEDLNYADLIIAELPQKGINQRYRIEGIDGGGLRLRPVDTGRTALMHTFDIKSNTPLARLAPFTRLSAPILDRNSVVWGTSALLRVDNGGC